MDIEIAICANPPVRQNDAVSGNQVIFQHQVCEHCGESNELAPIALRGVDSGTKYVLICP